MRRLHLNFSRHFYMYGAAVAGGILFIAIILYMSAQSLVANVITMQIRRAGYPDANIEQLRLYADGIVIEHVKLDKNTELRELYTDQSAPSIAKNGIQQLIVRHWVQNVPDMQSLKLNWPFPQIKRLSVENMQIKLDLPLQDIIVQGTVKSLQTEDERLALLMPFMIEKDNYNLNGNMEIALNKGKIESLDFNLDDGSYQNSDMMLKRLSGWMNIQATADNSLKSEAQFTAGAAHYNDTDFGDGMAQYSYATGQSAQWTVTLNRPAQDYFNTWVIKQTTREDRYAVQIAAQKGKETKTRTMITGLPLVLELLLQAP